MLSVNFNLLHNNCAHAHSLSDTHVGVTQSHVCENLISSFVRSTAILVVLVSYNSYHIHNLE